MTRCSSCFPAVSCVACFVLADQECRRVRGIPDLVTVAFKKEVPTVTIPRDNLFYDAPSLPVPGQARSLELSELLLCGSPRHSKGLFQLGVIELPRS